jgi:hypothetical protein
LSPPVLGCFFFSSPTPSPGPPGGDLQSIIIRGAGGDLILADAGDVDATAGALQALLNDADGLNDSAGLAGLADGEHVAEAAGELGEEAGRELLGRAGAGVEGQHVGVGSVEDDDDLAQAGSGEGWLLKLE